MEVGELALNARIVAKLIANRLSSPVQFGRRDQEELRSRPVKRLDRYNTTRRHSWCGYLAPEVFEEQCPVTLRSAS
ncbi:hypothetical protein [Corynebacterium deserti]|uniref:hypothetical protein n=1 Tax=Corynebacterium deserti TaxID=1408191 RepID=UPI0012E1C313|nr:hypothetical protein [Corynebacterium deserti]